MGNGSDGGHYAVGTPLDEEYGTTKARVVAALVSEEETPYDEEDLANQTGDNIEEVSEALDELTETNLVYEDDGSYIVDPHSGLYHAFSLVEQVRVGQLWGAEVNEELIGITDDLAELVDRELNMS